MPGKGVNGPPDTQDRSGSTSDEHVGDSSSYRTDKTAADADTIATVRAMAGAAVRDRSM